MERIGHEWFLEEGDALVIQHVNGEVTDEGHGFDVTDCGDADLFYWCPDKERPFEVEYHIEYDSPLDGRLKLKYPSDYNSE